MKTYLLYGDPAGVPEVRHEVAEAVSDPVVFIDKDGKRIVAANVFDAEIFRRREDVVDELWDYHSLGFEELRADASVPDHLIGPELVRRALERAGASSAVVPASFPLLVADYLRDRGIEVRTDEEEWAARRRRKTPWELEGIERAQRAVDAALVAAVHMLREAEPTVDGRLRFEGEILTCEWLRETMSAVLLSQGAESEEIIVQSGEACLNGHDPGLGPVWAGRSLVIDCFPRDRRTGVFTDTTRTFVPGEPDEELTRLHGHCLAALDIAREALRPGRSDAYSRVVEYFHSQGFPTVPHQRAEGPLRNGFIHALGHGVGLKVHEKPSLGIRSDALVEGDVLAIEPGLYRDGMGGVRLEDTYVITAAGPEPFTDPFPYDLTP
jgi:Xaa-Pro aminopeptidase